MKKNKKKQLMQWTGVLLTFFLMVGNVLGLKMVDPIEPVNPVAQEYEELEYEVIEEKEHWKQEKQSQEKEKQNQEQEKQNQEPEKKEGKTEQVSENESQGIKEEQADQNKEETNKSGEENVNSESEVGDNANDKSPRRGTSDGGESEDDDPDVEEADSEDSETEDTEMEESDSEDPDEEETDSEQPDSEQPEDTEPQEDEVNAGLVTDLESKIITFSELQNDTLTFYAYYSDATVSANIRVNYKHESETGNGTWLTASGRNYSAKLTMGKNVIVVYYTDKKGQRNYSFFTITYEAEKATEDEPEVGDKPPVIETNLDNWSGEISTQAFTFTVKARTANGAQIYSNHIVVKLDGQTVSNPTGSSVYEYVLDFKKPVVGETEGHKVTVMAWDDDGNSKMVTYNVTYRSIDVGEVTGQARVVVDATTVGVGVLADETVDIIQGKPASYTLLAALDQMNFEYEYAGTEMIGFYIRSISKGNAFKKAAIPSDLLTLIERDGLELRPACNKNKLSEYDFTQGSGWLYSVNGGEYAGKGLSEWNLNDGDTLYLRYTVAYGKDVGGTEEEYGRLKSYCGMWINGGYIPLEHAYQQTRVEPTETEDGYVEYCCNNCGHTYREVIPHSGTDASENE